LAAQLTLEGEPDRDPIVVEVFVPGHPPTPNARPGNWQAERRERDHWRSVAEQEAWAMRTAFGPGGPPAPLRRVDILEVWTYRVARRRDPDNQIAASKPLLDGLVAAGVLADDSHATIRRLAAEEHVDRYLTVEGVRFVITEVLP
jgi:hypothetical protein